MIRRLNYTGRRKISRDLIRISLYRNGGMDEFDAFIRTDGLELPPSARVFVEAYHKSDWMRFDFGTVGAPALPSDRRLTAFYEGVQVLFRVKVVSADGEAGKILAEADRLSPLSPDDDSDRDPLLPVRTVAGMGDQIWRVTWGYRTFHALARGVFTPAGDKKIILFVTAVQQEGLTQYENQLQGRLLHWEGERNHANDTRIAQSPDKGDEVHVFYREQHHAPFTYHGKAVVKFFELFTDKPSKFEFELESLNPGISGAGGSRGNPV